MSVGRHLSRTKKWERALQNIDTRLAGASPYSGNLHPITCKPGLRIEFGVQRARSSVSTALQGVGKLTFMAGIAAGILMTWQGITLHVQKFSVRPDTETPVAAVERWVNTAWKAALPQVQPTPRPTEAAFAAEQGMSRGQLLDRWNSLIAEAAQRFSLPVPWIRAVMQTESGGRTMTSHSRPITSHAGAMGLMQLMPATYVEMSRKYQLGSNPYDPHDNITAGVAYLSWLYHRYGYPAMFAAYNAGPGQLENRLTKGAQLPAETRNYVTHIVTAVGGNAASAKVASPASNVVTLTKPNGGPVKVRLAQITSLRVPLPGEYARSVKAVITMGRVHQGVRESYDQVKQALVARGAIGTPVRNSSTRLAAVARGSASHRNTRRHATQYATAKHRVRANYDLADDIRLHPLSHRAES